MQPLINKLISECITISTTNIPNIRFEGKDVISIENITCEVGVCNYGGIVFNITDAIKIGRFVLVGEQIKKEMRRMLASTDTDTTWYIKMYEYVNNQYTVRYTLKKITCEKKDFIQELTTWLRSEL